MLDAEVRLGQLIKNTPKAKGGQPYHKNSTKDSGVPSTKKQAVEEAGFSKKQAQRFEQLADNPEIVEQVIAEARANDDIVSRSAVMNKIKEKKQADKNSKRKADIERQAKEPQRMNYDRELEHTAFIFLF